MTDTMANIAKGAWAAYCRLPASNDALVAVVIVSAGVVSDATMQDYDTVSDLLAGASDESGTMTRKTLTGVTVTVDDTTNKVWVDAADPTWTAATGGATAKLVICYDADTTGGGDADLIPLFLLDFPATPNGGDITAVIAAGGLADAA